MSESDSITITLNGEPHSLPANTTLLQLSKQLELQGKRYAVERNEEIVPKSTHAEVIVQHGDVLEIVQAIGGG